MKHTSEQTPIRERWTALPDGGGDEATAGLLLRAAAQACPIGERRLVAIQARLRERRRSKTAVRPARRLIRHVAVAMGFVLFGGAISASVSHVLHRQPAQPSGHPEPLSSASRKLPTREPFPLAAPWSPASVSAPSLPESPPNTSPRLAISPTRLSGKSARSLTSHEPPISPPTEQVSQPSLAPDPVATVAPPAGPSELARESRLLARAIAKLRQDNDPETSLALLDEHKAEFMSGVLAPEATVTRIEALLRLGRQGQALALLDGQVLFAKGVGREMLAARAELRADVGRFSDALEDFNRLLAAPSRPDAVFERAMYGRPVCLSRIGDWAGARLDFEKYLAEFPQGRFAPQARSALKEELH